MRPWRRGSNSGSPPPSALRTRFTGSDRLVGGLPTRVGGPRACLSYALAHAKALGPRPKLDRKRCRFCGSQGRRSRLHYFLTPLDQK